MKEFIEITITLSLPEWDQLRSIARDAGKPPHEIARSLIATILADDAIAHGQAGIAAPTNGSDQRSIA